MKKEPAYENQLETKSKVNMVAVWYWRRAQGFQSGGTGALGFD
jgi:hypothetical protein